MRVKNIVLHAVVALFNAISQQRQASGALVDELPGPKKGSKRPRPGDASRAVGDMTKSAFLDMLNGKSKSQSKGSKSANSSNNNNNSSTVAAPDLGAPQDVGWSVLKDDFMIGHRGMKDWDKGSDEDSDADGGAAIGALGEADSE